MYTDYHCVCMKPDVCRVLHTHIFNCNPAFAAARGWFKNKTCCCIKNEAVHVHTQRRQQTVPKEKSEPASRITLP